METLQMLSCQKDKFRLEDHVTYLNGAYMSPSLKSVEKAGHEAVTRKCRPYQIKAEDFFTHTKRLRELFARFIDAPDYRNTSIIPSASYGLATVAKNVKLKAGDEILLIDEQFPSNVYIWQKLAEQNNATVKVIRAPKIGENRANIWNKNMLNGISSKTAIVAMPPAHWADGTLYDLIAIRKKTKQYNALLIIDGSQFIGAAPFSVKEIQPDALITVAYKWMLGPYSMGMAYYSDYFNEGEPIEENWINRHNSEDFAGLVNYESRYQPKAGRYNMGESSNFINTPMLIKSIQQLLEWRPENIQQYCEAISKQAIEQLRNKGCFVEHDNYRTKHLFGVYLSEHIDLEKLKAKFTQNNIYVSFRGNAIRISPNLYNTEADFEKLVDCFN
ncbi:MAG: aminotransferase class V-fold PLP-dependent enzyme [Flavobacteriaceae bacterium]|nr:aminotransferase class V-fold PLP-dependent enzyme [Flavobacteriaceae bacterium]